MRKFEYQKGYNHFFGEDRDNQALEFLTEEGKKGWELCFWEENESETVLCLNVSYIFKRVIIQLSNIQEATS